MGKRFIYIIVWIGLFLVISCQDFLNLEPKSDFGVTDKFYKNDEDIEYALTAIYANLQISNYYQNGMVLMTDVRSDDLSRFVNTGANAGREYTIKMFKAAADNQVFLNVWTAIYQTIYRCNKVLISLDVIQNEERKIQIEGETRFIRGLCYFNIVRFWGDAPLLLIPLTPKESASCIRNSKEEIYTAIEKDLLFAADVNHLPLVFTGSNTGRVTSLAAQALLGKVYLTQNKWQDVVNILGKLIHIYNNGTHELLSDIASVFSGAPPIDSTDSEFSNYTGYKPTKINKEVLFAVLWNKDIPDEGRHKLNYYNNEGDINEYFKISSSTCLYAKTDRRRDLMRHMNGSSTDNNFLLKFADTPGVYNTYEFSTVILRWADVLLMYAEALNEIGFEKTIASESLIYLNQVRTRSYPEGRYQPSDFSNQDEMREAIYLERRMEFPMEMQRWFDLVRTGRAIEEISKIGITITSRDLLYPIPNTEYLLRNDPERFPQNPGY